MSSRDPWFDNAKMTLVTLAVVGHAWGMLPSTPTYDGLFDFLYVWHMPAFVMLSGYLSRRFDWSGPRLRSLVMTLLVPYLVFATALGWFEVQLGWGERADLYLVPVWPLWYLIALACWRLVAPVFRALPVPVALGVAVAVSLGGGMLDVSVLGLSRVMGMLPFFVLGLVVTPDLVARVRTPAAQLAGVASLLAALVLVRHLDSFASTEWLFYQGYDEVGAGHLHGVVVRALLLALALGCSLGALALVPRADGWFTRMGSATMVVFLVHGFVVRAVDGAGLVDWAAAHPTPAVLLVVLGSVGLSLLLATPRSVRLFTPVVDPFGWWRGRATPDPATVPQRREADHTREAERHRLVRAL